MQNKWFVWKWINRGGWYWKSEVKTYFKNCMGGLWHQMVSTSCSAKWCISIFKMNDPDNTMNAALKEVKCIQKAEFQLHDF